MMYIQGGGASCDQPPFSLVTEQAIEIAECVFGFLFCRQTEFPLHFTDITGTFPRVSVSYLCARSLERLRAFAGGLLWLLCARVDGFPVLRLLRPNRHFLRHWGFVGVSLTYFPLPLTSLQEASRVHKVGR